MQITILFAVAKMLLQDHPGCPAKQYHRDDEYFFEKLIRFGCETIVNIVVKNVPSDEMELNLEPYYTLFCFMNFIIEWTSLVSTSPRDIREHFLHWHPVPMARVSVSLVPRSGQSFSLRASITCTWLLSTLFPLESPFLKKILPRRKKLKRKRFLFVFGALWLVLSCPPVHRVRKGQDGMSEAGDGGEISPGEGGQSDGEGRLSDGEG